MEGSEGMDLSAFTSALTQIQTGFKSAITEIAPVIASVAITALVLFLIPWAVRKLRSAFSKAA